MLYEIVYRFPKDMIFKEDGPLISLYQLTHRSGEIEYKTGEIKFDDIDSPDSDDILDDLVELEL